MTKNNFNGILCSKKCNNFILLSDGLGSYLLYYDSDLILEIAESKNPKKIYKYEKLANPVHKIKENYKNSSINEEDTEEIIYEWNGRKYVLTLPKVMVVL